MIIKQTSDVVAIFRKHQQEQALLIQDKVDLLVLDLLYVVDAIDSMLEDKDLVSPTVTRSVKFTMDRAFDKVLNDIKVYLDTFAFEELDFIHDTLSDVYTNMRLSKPNREMLSVQISESNFAHSLFNEPRTLKGVLSEFKLKKSKDVVMLLNDNILLDNSPQEFISELHLFVTGKIQRQLSTLIRTSMNFVRNQTYRTYGLENQGMFKKDVVTECKMNTQQDMHLIKSGTGAYPPLHWNCNTLRIPAEPT